jgi:hypothetical protein
MERLIGLLLCLDYPEAEHYTSTLMSSDLTVTDIYDTLFRSDVDVCNVSAFSPDRSVEIL